jgi:hypothetical protein
MAQAIDRSAYLNDVVAVLERATILLREEHHSYAGPWGLHDALDRAWREQGASPAVLYEARDWLLRAAAELARANNLRITASRLPAYAVETVRLTFSEDVHDA